MSDYKPEPEKWEFAEAGSHFIAIYENNQRKHFVADLDENPNSRIDGPFIVRACQTYGRNKRLMALSHRVLGMLMVGVAYKPEDIKKLIAELDVAKVEGK